jgi:DNA-binding transcriptional regulator PaaX
VTLTPTERGQRFTLTAEGEVQLHLLELEERLHRRPRRWDKKWRLLIFDISEQRKKLREALRHKLIELGFYRLQDSVWIYPYPCNDLMELLRIKFGVRHDALFLHVDSFPSDPWLRRHFGLK